MEQSILIVGHGYFGGHLSGRLTDDTFRLTATTRKSEKAKALEARNISAVDFDVLNPQAPPISQKFEAIVYCIGFDRQQGASRHDVYVSGLQNFLSKIQVPPDRFIYVSSTGVYGQTAGEWVDEESATHPTREGGRVCLDAEKLLQGCKGLADSDVTVLRLAGIYGPDRIPNREKLELGQLSMRAEGYLNLIHVEDAAEITKLFIQESFQPSRFRVFNVADGSPGTREEFYRKMSELLGVQPPTFLVEPAASPTRQDGSKRVSSQKLIQETGYQLMYPSYVQGLSAILF